MPWSVVKRGDNNFVIIRSDTGKVVGHSTSKAKAEASVRARYASLSQPEITRLKKKGHAIKT